MIDRPNPSRPRYVAAKRAWATPLADFVAPCIEPAVAKRGFAAADLVLNWPEIVGERLARVCEPVKLQWPPRARERGLDESAQPGTQAASLVVRVEGAFALELQHTAAVVVERVNTHLGWRCVGKLVLRQGPLQGDREKRRMVQPPDPAAQAAAAETAAPIEDPALREAITRLGARVFATRPSKTRERE